MGEWRTMRIEDIARKIAMGPFGSNIKVETFVPRGVPIISGQHLHNARFDERSGFNFITEEHAEKLKNSNVFAGDIVFTHAGNIGQVAVIPDNVNYERYVISQRQFYLRVDTSKADPAFIARWFHGPLGKHRLLMHASQVGVPSISRPATNLKCIQIELPPLSEQSAISEVFDAIDDKIELNRRMNETLEAMARAIFKDWFVDFGPTRAKAEGRAPYLAPELWDLFPDALNDEDKPVGWSEIPLMQLGTVITGKTPSTKKPEFFGDEMPFLKIPDMHGRIYVLRTSTELSEEGARSQEKKTLPAGSVSASCIATPGLVIFNHRDTQTNQQINSIVPTDRRQSHFVFWSCRQLASAVMLGGSGGSVFHNMNKTSFENLRLGPVDIHSKDTVV